MSYEEMVKYLADNLRLDVVVSDSYTGGDPLYKKTVTIQLVLDGSVISEVYLD